MSLAGAGGLPVYARDNHHKEDHMGKLIVTEFISVDGVIEDPGGGEDYERGGWAFEFQRGDEGDKFKLDEVTDADAQLLGRVTYEGFAGAWPDRTDEVGFADKMNTMPKYVVSTTLEEAEWNNTTIISGDLVEEIAKVKHEHGEVLVAGSATLAQGLMEHDLVDELRLMVFPLILGEGKRLFHDGLDKATLRLGEARPVGPDGVVILTYERARG
jgi:dihydrofolate reductase